MIAHGAIAELSSDFDLASVVWAALEKIAAGQCDRDQLDRGGSHQVQLALIGHVDGMPFRQDVASHVTIGHDQEKATSVTPELPKLIAYLLSKLNQSTRDKLLREIPTEFEANQSQLPEPDDELIGRSKELLARLRQKKTIHARGPVKCRYEL